MIDDRAARILVYLAEQVRLLLDEDAPRELSAHTNLRIDLGLDSLSFMSVFFSAADAYQVDVAAIPTDRFAKIDTLGDISMLLAEFSQFSPT